MMYYWSARPLVMPSCKGTLCRISMAKVQIANMTSCTGEEQLCSLLASVFCNRLLVAQVPRNVGLALSAYKQSPRQPGMLACCLCRHMASGGEDGSVALWDLDTMACDRTCTHMDGEVKTVSISHDSQYVAYAGEQDYLVMESIQGGEDAGGRSLYRLALPGTPIGLHLMQAILSANCHFMTCPAQA